MSALPKSDWWLLIVGLAVLLALCVLIVGMLLWWDGARHQLRVSGSRGPPPVVPGPLNPFGHGQLP